MEASVAEPDAREKKVAARSFRVFEERTLDDGGPLVVWVLLTDEEPVIAPSGKAAVREVVGDAGGRFFTIPDSQYDPKTRTLEEEPQPTKIKESWS